jgi:hypothetical protein
MKEHRHAFEQSYVQRQFREIDVRFGYKPDQAPHKVYHIVQVIGTSIRRNIDISMHTLKVKDRQGNRFTSMLHEQYGGRKAIREFLLTGSFNDIRLPPLDRLPEGKRRQTQPPPPQPTYKAKKMKSDSYIGEQAGRYPKEALEQENAWGTSVSPKSCHASLEQQQWRGTSVYARPHHASPEQQQWRWWRSSHWDE